VTKLIRRHPHVFGSRPGDAPAATARGSWEQVKRAEAQPAAGRIEAGARGLPALLEAYRVQEKAAGFGFDWPDVAGVIDKLGEEEGELRGALAAGDARQTHAEVGDLLFTLVNLARHLRGDPEQILKRTTRKFQDRFARMEAILEREGRALPEADLPAMESAWQRAKREEG
jgi:ATP diphosphatase